MTSGKRALKWKPRDPRFDIFWLYYTSFMQFRPETLQDPQLVEIRANQRASEELIDEAAMNDDELF